MVCLVYKRVLVQAEVGHALDALRARQRSHAIVYSSSKPWVRGIAPYIVILCQHSEVNDLHC